MTLTQCFPFFAAVLLAGAPAAQVERGAEPAPAPVAAPLDQEKEQEKKTVLEVGDKVPEDLALPDIDGKIVRFGDLRGKVVFVHFWSTVCPWEVPAQPKLTQIRKDFGGKGVVAFAINANQNEIGPQPAPEAFEDKENPPYAGIRQTLAEKQADFHVLVDHGNKVSSLFQGRTTPHCYVIDGEGVLRYAGALCDDGRNQKGDEAQHFVRMAIEAVLEGREVEPTTTRPYG